MIIFLPLFDHLALAEYGFIAFKSFTQSTHINNDSDSDYNNDSNYYYYYYNDNNNNNNNHNNNNSCSNYINSQFNRAHSYTYYSSYLYRSMLHTDRLASFRYTLNGKQ